MIHLFLVLSFIALVFSDTHPCETGDAPCPAGFRCQPSVGCVKDSKTHCQCPETPCAFPSKCDCHGSCKVKTCTSTKSCSLMINPHDACEKATCLDGKCVAVQETCAGCNKKTGCPSASNLHPRVISSSKSNPSEEEQVRKEDDSEWDHDDDDDDDDHHHHHHSEPVAWPVYLGMAFLIIIGVAFICVLIYLGCTSTQTGIY